MSTATVYQFETADQAKSLKVTQVGKPVADAVARERLV
jgi:hypothetical protein